MLFVVRSIGKMKGKYILLLKGNAVLSIIKNQKQQELKIGTKVIKHLPNYEKTLKDMLKDNIHIYASERDCKRYHIANDKVIEGIKLISVEDIPRLFELTDLICFW
jgi:sulfur relay (sulfurtransferase) DsrF/TusC family protein